MEDHKSTAYDFREYLTSFSLSIIVRKILKGICETASKSCCFAKKVVVFVENDKEMSKEI